MSRLFSGRTNAVFYACCAIVVAVCVAVIVRYRVEPIELLQAALSYDLAEVRGGAPVPRVFIDDLPAHFASDLTVDERKNLFIKALLPLILRENEQIRRERAAVERGTRPRLMKKYRIAPKEDIPPTRRVDIVPVSLVLAQAAIESAWGRSRFAHEANNFFGQRSYDLSVPGIKPARAEGFRVVAFDTAARSIASYMRNLNTHPAYRDFRLARERLRNAGTDPRGTDLAAHLHAYSERGKAYLETVQKVIRDNGLHAFDDAKLALP